jgi:hypothetical protein
MKHHLDILKKWFTDDLTSKSIRQLRMNSELRQNEFDQKLQEFLDSNFVIVKRYDYDEVGDQVPVEYALSDQVIQLMSEI